MSTDEPLSVSKAKENVDSVDSIKIIHFCRMENAAARLAEFQT